MPIFFFIKFPFKGYTSPRRSRTLVRKLLTRR
jgi:hypothetical protein